MFHLEISLKVIKTDIIMETYWTDKNKDEKKKQLWARVRCGNIWRGHQGRGGHPCRGCKVEKGRAYRELWGIWVGFGNECARLVDGFKGPYRRLTTGEDQENRRGSTIRLKKREQDNKKPKTLKGYGHEQFFFFFFFFYSSVYNRVSQPGVRRPILGGPRTK